MRARACVHVCTHACFAYSASMRGNFKIRAAPDKHNRLHATCRAWRPIVQRSPLLNRQNQEVTIPQRLGAQAPKVAAAEARVHSQHKHVHGARALEPEPCVPAGLPLLKVVNFGQDADDKQGRRRFSCRSRGAQVEGPEVRPELRHPGHVDRGSRSRRAGRMRRGHAHAI